MDWFERLTGFTEGDYAATQAKLAVEGTTLVSRVNGKRYGIGTFSMPALGDLRARVAAGSGPAGTLTVEAIAGNARALHATPEAAGALFQVASQFNMLEMVSPAVTPEDGVARYEHDHTQGPACALAAGAATIYRNYLVPVDGHPGQRADRQLNGLADLGAALSQALGMPVADLWAMRNGYALLTAPGLKAIDAHLAALDEAGTDALRARLRIGLHAGVEVTDVATEPRPVVTQAFCSALPIAYTRGVKGPWKRFASLILEAAYEATLLAAVVGAREGGSKAVFLTSLGGGVFGNDMAWITAAMRRALEAVRGFALEVRLVSYGSVAPELAEVAQEMRS
jgi:hypothetical protein